MGSMLNKNKGTVQSVPAPNVNYSQLGGQQSQMMSAHSQMMPQSGMMPQQQFMPQAPQPAFPAQGPPPMRPPYPSGPGSQMQPPSMPPPMDSSSFENDMFLASLTGWSLDDIQRLRHEFYAYANQLGVIDRDGFRKLYIASLLNMTWDTIERDAEMAFRNFDLNHTGGLDFHEYITACARMSRDVNARPPPRRDPPFVY